MMTMKVFLKPPALLKDPTLSHATAYALTNGFIQTCPQPLRVSISAQYGATMGKPVTGKPVEE